MKITEDKKLEVTSYLQVAKMYSRADNEIGYYMRGLFRGMELLILAIGKKRSDFLSKKCPSIALTNSAFMMLFEAYKLSELKKEKMSDEDKIMLFGKDAKKMMKQAEEEVKIFLKEEKL